MYPTLLKLGPIAFHSYGLMMAIAFLTAIFFIRRDAKKYDLNADVLIDGAFWTLILGLLGTRIFHIVMFPEAYFNPMFTWKQSLVNMIAVWRGGLVFQGAIPFALPFLWWWLRKNKLPFLKTMDIAIPYIPLAHGIGRIGCFLNGCCFGRRSDLPWAIAFPRVPLDLSKPIEGSPPYIHHAQYGLPPDALWSYPVHPTQLYETFALTLMFFVLLFIRNKFKPFAGSLISLYLILYGLFRTYNESLRDDGNPVRILNLTDQQVFSLLTVGLGIGLFAGLWYQSKRTTASATDRAKD
ncbi:MAG: prolipoprotein diacylglyceryl transferase [Candidatus Hydrogenedentota bacterium]